jgi:hypothetical protein
MTSAMPMMPPMILMERICKEAEFVLNLPVTHVIAVPVATHLDPEPTTDWSWKICLLVHLGRI